MIMEQVILVCIKIKKMRKKGIIIIFCICSSAFLGCQNFVAYLKAPVSNQQANDNSVNKKPNSTPSSTVDPIIGTPTKIGNLEVAQNDFPNRMEWNNAVKACSELGNGWRLPTKNELNFMYSNRVKIGRFANNDYWSSTEEDSDNAWRQYFNGGSQALLFKNRGFANVRAVRTF